MSFRSTGIVDATLLNRSCLNSFRNLIDYDNNVEYERYENNSRTKCEY